jgi:flavin reductase (DIM6/NTAB) family NADH-FMN oxidoreductase RutF
MKRPSSCPQVQRPRADVQALMSARVVEVARTNIQPGEIGEPAFYKLLTAVVVPRPIAWVSSRSAAGIDNLAPHSFFTVAAIDPPVVQFTSVGYKDSVRNIQETGEFVVNLAPASMFEQINATATAFPAGESEFDAVGVEREQSLHVAPPRVARSPVALECALHATSTIGISTVVMGRVVNAAIDEDVIQDGLPAIERLAPLARLGRDEWSEIGRLLEITRIPYESWPGHYRR